MVNKITDFCKHCGAPKKREYVYVESDHVKRLRRIMKRYALTESALGEILGISQPTINGWFSYKYNPTGHIEARHFQTLKQKGYI